VDLIIIQVEGSKQWKIYDPPISHPYVAKHKANRQGFNEFLNYGSLIFDKEIHRTDFLFVPAGYWHHCENRSDRSIHVAFAIHPPTAFSIISELLKDYLREEPFCLPLSRIDDRKEKDKFISKITCELAEKFKNMVCGSEEAP
jgi:ribosomal protein L16 Arg81 hydroxylase